MTPTAPRANEVRRSDAQQNRALILDAALAALMESSTASLNSIAKRAGVGIATLYRHFPTRQDLLAAVYWNELQQLVEAADRLLETEQPLTALRSWLDRFAYDGMAKAGLADALDVVASHDRLAAETYGPVIAALTKLLDANERAGTIRAGVPPDDVLLLLGFLWRVDPAGDWQQQSGLLLDIVIDGLHAGATGTS